MVDHAGRECRAGGDIGRASGIDGARLLVIDPRPLMRDCLAVALGDADSVASVLAVGDVDEAGTALSAGREVDVAVVNMAGTPLSDAALGRLTGALRRHGMTGPVVLLASVASQRDVAAALRHGISGFLSGQTPFDLTIDAIRFVRLGLAVYPAAEIVAPFVEAPPPLEEIEGLDRDFTPRQRQVLRGLERGMTNKGIAIALSVSERTVKAHVKELMRRLNAHNRTQVVAIMSHGQGGDGSAL